VSESVLDIVGDTPTVCIDFKNAKSYLALPPTFALEDALGLAFDWLPVNVSALTRPAARQPHEDRGAQHRRMRAEYNERDLRRYASVYGLELGDLYRNPDTTSAGIGLLFAKRDRNADVRRYLQIVFERYWGDRLDLEDSSAIAAALGEAGASIDGWQAFATGTGRADFERVTTTLRDGGVFDAPAYIVAGDVYFGRQHLPMIEWQLTGRRGEPPL
jgi:2-hydroxychromene-2-carboxylate isomerase